MKAWQGLVMRMVKVMSKVKVMRMVKVKRMAGYLVPRVQEGRSTALEHTVSNELGMM